MKCLSQQGIGSRKNSYSISLGVVFITMISVGELGAVQPPSSQQEAASPDSGHRRRSRVRVRGLDFSIPRPDHFEILRDPYVESLWTAGGVALQLADKEDADVEVQSATISVVPLEAKTANDVAGCQHYAQNEAKRLGGKVHTITVLRLSGADRCQFLIRGVAGYEKRDVKSTVFVQRSGTWLVRCTYDDNLSEAVSACEHVLNDWRAQKPRPRAVAKSSD